MLGAREDLRQMLASLRELALRRTGAELDESLLLVPDLPRQDGKPSAGEAQQSGGDGDSKPSATPTGPHLPGGPFLVSMETILRTLQTFDEADLEPNPCADPDSWSDGLEAHIREYVVSTKPRELKRLLMTFLRADATGLLEASEIKELFGRLLLRKWRARHVGACIFNRFLKGSLSCEQIAEMSLCGETLATATMHVYPKVGMRSCTSDSLEAMNYYERMGPRVEETLQHGVQLPDQIGSQNEGCIHIMNIPSGNVNLSLLPQDVLVDSAAARAAVAQFSKSNFWNKAGHLVWAGHHKHPEQDCLLARLHPELLRRVCSFLIFPNDDRCWRR
uniref:Uncharacterized protein n=1 Tax=Pinguiococcus pyrenoidosus TaxID=172671 RepID=A0A7R9U8M0_9STRA